MKNFYMVQVLTNAGARFDEVVEEAQKIAKKLKTQVRFSFNGQLFDVTEHTELETLWCDYSRSMKRGEYGID